jgi:hypothetical protein
MSNSNKYILYILKALLLISIIIGIIYFFKSEKNGFNANFGNMVKEFKFSNIDSKRLTDILKIPDEEETIKYILNLDTYINITGFKVELFDEYEDVIIKYRLKVENDLINEYVKSNGEIEFKAGEYYDIRDSNYNIKQLFILMDSTTDIKELDKIASIKIYGIKQYDKIIDDDITVIKNYDTQQINIQFNKLRDIDNIEYYFIIIAKYNNNKEFLSKQIIRLNNNKINFTAKLEKLIPSEYIDYSTSISVPNITSPNLTGEITLEDILKKKSSESFEQSKITEKTTLKEASNILSKYKKDELLDIFKLILHNQYLENDKNVSTLLENINDYSNMKFLDNGIGDDNETFIRKWEQNYYYYQNEEIKQLLKYTYDLIENYNDSCTEYTCLISSPKLDVVDAYDNPYYYKVGVGYIRLDVLGNEIFSPITSYRDKGEVLFTIKKDYYSSEEEETTGDNLYNKLNMVNNVAIKNIRGIIGSNYPNNFYISEQNLKDYVDLDEYKDNKYSPIQFNINITDKESIPETTAIASFTGDYKSTEERINNLLD